MAVCAIRAFGVLFGVVLLALGPGSSALANPEGGSRDRDRDNEPGGEPPSTQQVITVSTENGEIRITSVMVVTNTEAVLGALTETGVLRVNEDRLDLGNVPLVGGWFGGGDDDEGDEPVRIGVAYLIGSNLTIDVGTPIPAASVSSQPYDTGADFISAGSAIESHIQTVSTVSQVDSGLTYDLDGEPFSIDGFKLLNRGYSYYIPGTDFLVVGHATEAPSRAAGPSKLPVLGDVPLLDNLFSSPAGDVYRQGRDLVVLIKPSILEDDYE